MGRLCCNEQNLENVKDAGIKAAFSLSAPETDASDIQWIIG